MHNASFKKFVNKVTALNVIFDKDEHKRPHCKHGPTLLLKKRIGYHEKQFLACSAYRDNKCPILKCPVDTEKLAQERKKIRKNLIKIVKTRKEERAFCRTCDELFLHREFHKHQWHDVLDKIPIKYIRRPTMLLKASRNKEREAQYLFAERTIDFVVNILDQLGFDRLILIGCPSIHERVQCQKRTLNMESILLDIDPRYCQFYLRKSFVLFNMFNNFFFEGKEGQRKFEKFLEKSLPGKTCLLVDPPFGALIQAISRTIDKIHARWLKMHLSEKGNEDVQKKLNPDSYNMGVIFFLPYFSEPKVKNFTKGVKMSDYKVNYNNHSAFRDCSCRGKVGSAVRLFTNIKQSLFELPLEEGYKFCELCQRYSSRENRHCFKCGVCTAKDGRPSRHCELCNKCVKDTWSHCKKCGFCGLPSNHTHKF